MEGRPRTDVFRIRGFVAYWSSYTVSGFGSYVTTLALQVLVLDSLHGSATDIGLLNAARWLPYLLFGLLVGALVDRRRRKPLLIGSDLGRAVVLTAIPALFVVGWLSLPVLLALVAVIGFLSLVGDAASQSLLPRIVPRPSLVAAHARTDQSDAVAQTSGPLVAGALVSLVGAAFATLVDAASYLFSAVAIWRIPVDEPRAPRRPSRLLWQEIGDGLRWVYRHRVLGPMAIGTHAWFFFNSILGTVFVPFALVRLGLTPFQFGIALAAAGAAGLVGSSLSTRTGLRWGAGRAVIASNTIMAVGWAVIAVVPADRSSVSAVVSVLVVGQGLYGLGLGLSNANEMGYRQAVTPDALQARTNTTIRSINRAMIVAGAPLGGLLAVTIGYTPTLWIGIAGFVGVALFFALSPFRDARHESAVTGR